MLAAAGPFAVVAVVSHAGDRPPGAQPRAIDRAGTVQLLYTFDGSQKRKAVRTFAQGDWTTVADAPELTTVASAAGVSLFWTGLRAGDRFGYVTAAPGACRSAGLDANLQPQQMAS